MKKMHKRDYKRLIRPDCLPLVVLSRTSKNMLRGLPIRRFFSHGGIYGTTEKTATRAFHRHLEKEVQLT